MGAVPAGALMNDLIKVPAGTGRGCAQSRRAAAGSPARSERREQHGTQRGQSAGSLRPEAHRLARSRRSAFATTAGTATAR